MMDIISFLFGIPLGYVMFACYQIFGSYGISIILFTLITKVIMFPLSIISQKNSIVMVKIKPMLDDIRQRYAGNNSLIMQEQKKLYKAEKYSTFKGVLPLLIQIPIIFGLIDVIYNPLQHLLHMDKETIDKFLGKTAEILGTHVQDMGFDAQLKTMELIQSSPEKFEMIDGVSGSISQILNVDPSFIGFNMMQIPTWNSLTILFPIISGISALALCLYQNKYNVLQRDQGVIGQYGMTIFLVIFSFAFAFLLPCGIGLYWIVGNVLSILVLALCNKIYDPRKYIDYENRKKTPTLSKEEKSQQKLLNKEKKAKEKIDKKRFVSQKDKQLVFYSESSGFYKYFEGMIDYVVSNSDITVHYVTNDYNDQIFNNENPQIEKYYIGPIALIQFMMLMDADMVVMTLPELEQYHIKRSLVRKDIEYIFLDHGMTSFHLMLRANALEHYDTIFCYGPNHIVEVRDSERVYGFPEKKLVKTGYGLLDTLQEKVRNMDMEENDPKIILIGPSWQIDNIMDYCLDELLEPLLAENYKIIVRPHPEFVKRFPMKIKAIIEQYEDRLNENFIIETDFSSNVTVYTADIVITDWSSIAQEFSYATKKPSVFINTPMKVMNPEYEKISIVPLDITLRDEIGVSVDVDKLSELPSIVNKLITEKEEYAERISKVIDDNLYNVGSAASSAGKYIVSTLNERKLLKEQKKDSILGIENLENDDLVVQNYDVEKLAILLDEIVRNKDNYEEQMLEVLDREVDDYYDTGMTNGGYLIDILTEIKEIKEENKEENKDEIKENKDMDGGADHE